MSAHHKDDPEKMQKMYQWLEKVCAELDVDPEIVHNVVPHLLALTSDVAHGPSRPAAPMTTFLLGLAAARGDTDGTSNVEHWTESTLINATHLQSVIAETYPEAN